MADNRALITEIRDEVVAALQADAALLALIPRLYPAKTPSNPVWPFGKMGAPVVNPQYIDGGDGTLFSAAYHFFVKGSAAILDPEAYAMQAASEAVRVLADFEAPSIGDGLTLDIYPRQVQVVQDEEADAFHSFVTFDADAS